MNGSERVRELGWSCPAILPIAQNMFNNVVTALRSRHPWEVIYQLDVSTSQSAEFEENLRKQIRDFFYVVELVPVLLLHVSFTKKSSVRPYSSRSTPSGEPQRQDPTDDSIKTGTPTTKQSPLSVKQAILVRP
jgi:hypothetical protein